MKIRVRSKMDEYLNKRGIKKVWLSEQIKCGTSQISRWCKNGENGEAISTPSVGYLLLLQKVLECEIEDLYEIIE
jgi:DNA-binding Xre family transcriptional regulator